MQIISTIITYKKAILISLATSATVIWGWAALTKAWYIPNFLNLEILCNNTQETNFENYTPQQDSWFINSYGEPDDKPVIYLYPETTQDITVKLDYQGKLIADYPAYDDSIQGWKVTANPDGTILNHADQKEYNYLFWEGVPEKKINWDLSTGFVVKGEDIREFLQQKLKEIGLTPKEYNEFIVYWYPLMQHNPYNLIHFAQAQYTDHAPLTITPQPDSILRVFMVTKPLNKKIEIQTQNITPFQRNWFSAVEWGGTQIK